MKLSANSAIGGAVAIAAFLGVAGLRPAQAADNVRVRGTVASLEGSTLTVKTREGPTSALALKPGWKVTGVAAASVGDIKPGDFVAPCQPRPGGTGRLRF